MRAFALLCVAFFGVWSASTVWAAPREAPTFLSVELRNPYLSAGDRLDIRVKAIPGSSPIMTNSGTNVYLGAIPQNLFPQSDSLNRSLTQLAPDEFEVSDLVVNPWVSPLFQKYTIMSFKISDQSGRQAHLFADEKVPFYYDDEGRETSIPVMRFHVNDNPLADVTPPLILSMRLDKTEYGPGEEIVIDLEATDDVSGVMLNSLAAVGTPTILLKQSSELLIQGRGPNHYQVRGLLLKDDLSDAPEESAITLLIVMDHARNWGGITQPSPEADHYINVKGEKTSFGVARFKVRRK